MSDFLDGVHGLLSEMMGIGEQRRTGMATWPDNHQSRQLTSLYYSWATVGPYYLYLPLTTTKIDDKYR